jgi:hypothetical protein
VSPHCPDKPGEKAATAQLPGVASQIIALWPAIFAAPLLLWMRWCYAHSYRWNSDESQHLHVVWGWTNGLLPYRDVFDNHTPLFHFLSAPLFALLGERPDIVIPMRLAMVPLFGLSLWCIYRIGTEVFSPQSGIWSAIILGFFPCYFFVMGQYRTDVLWTALWVALLLVLTSGSLGRRKSFFAGLILGAAFCVSMKSTLLLLIVTIAGALTWGFLRLFASPEAADAPSRIAQPRFSLPAALGGLLFLPLLVVGYFTLRGALGPFYYCVIRHNTLPGEHTAPQLLQRLASWSWLTMLPALALALTIRPLFATDPSRAARRVFLIFCAGLFYPMLHGLWRMITPQDYVPWFPPVVLVIVACVTDLGNRSHLWKRLPLVTAGLFVLFTGAEIYAILEESPIFAPGSVHHMAAIAQALRLTERTEYVMDAKGDLIFRPRPYYYALETLTRERLAAGLLVDDLPERLIETRTALVRIPHVGMTERALAFVYANYVSVGFVSVLGKALSTSRNGAVTFDVTIPARYSVVSRSGSVEALLDGRPLVGGRWLEAGRHELQLVDPNAGPDLILVWTRALERGCPPSFDPSPVCNPGRRRGHRSRFFLCPSSLTMQ